MSRDVSRPGCRSWLASLRARLILLVLLALIPAFVLILYTALEQRRLATAQVQETALRLARLASSDQGRLITGSRQLLVGLAQLTEVRRRDSQRCSRLLAEVLQKYPVYANLGAIAPDGKLFCSALPMPGSVNLADRGYFRRAVEHRDFAIGDYQIGRVTRRASINVGYPAVNGAGKVEAVVFAAIDLGWLNRFVAEAQLPGGSAVMVLDQNGTILARHPDGEAWIGRAAREVPAVQAVLTGGVGVAEASDLDGGHRLYGFSPLLGTPKTGDVFIAIGIPSELAFGAANRSLARNLLALGIVGSLALVAAWVGGDAFVLRRVNTLVGATQRLAAGDLTVRTGIRGNGELDHLARAFDEMAEALEKTHQSEKMAALGRLAAGVAHELRNPLTVIDGRLRLLRMQLERGEGVDPRRLADLLPRFEDASERMKAIIAGMSDYSKPVKATPTRLDVGELLAGTRELVAYQARKAEVTVNLDVPADRPSILGDRSEMTQILLNLATNAIEAMAGSGGALTLRARTQPGQDGAARVVIEVADTGPGIAVEALEKVWQAFYTTKAEGTGLGLSIVRALVEKQPGAEITVETAVGVGTTFRVTMTAA
jgi:signal transduction histidine kinase